MFLLPRSSKIKIHTEQNGDRDSITKVAINIRNIDPFFNIDRLVKTFLWVYLKIESNHNGVDPKC